MKQMIQVIILGALLASNAMALTKTKVEKRPLLYCSGESEMIYTTPPGAPEKKGKWPISGSVDFFHNDNIDPKYATAEQEFSLPALNVKFRATMEPSKKGIIYAYWNGGTAEAKKELKVSFIDMTAEGSAFGNMTCKFVETNW